MERHVNISSDHVQKTLIHNLSSDPRIQNEWIANFLKSYAGLTKQIEDLQMLLAVMDDNERREKVTKSQNKKGRKRASIPGLDPQSLAQTISSRNKATITNVPNKETHFHAKKR